MGLSGPSGLGKTELLRAIAGLRDSDAGTFRLDGRSREAIGYPEWRRRVTYVAQRASFVDATVGESLARPARYRAVGQAVEERVVRGWLAALGLPRGVWQERPKTLSAGEQQRVALVRALSIRPSVLLLDEPTSALDAESTARVEALLAERVDEDSLAIVVVSHDHEQLGRLASRRYDLSELVPTRGERDV